jgi:hypothetical protein
MLENRSARRRPAAVERACGFAIVQRELPDLPSAATVTVARPM